MNDIERFQKMLDDHAHTDGVYIGNGKGKRVEDIDAEDFLNKVKKWGEQSFQGLVCGIFGCIEKVDTKCNRCGVLYCQEHRQYHNQEKEYDGFIKIVDAKKEITLVK